MDKLKNRDVFHIREILLKWTKIKNKKFSIVIWKNLNIVNTLIDTFDKLIPNYHVYTEKKLQIIDKYNGVWNNDKKEYIIDDKYIDDFNKEMDDLDFNYVKTLELLNSDCVVSFYKLDLDDLPDELSVEDINELEFMIY
jgi:hypothetical protein